MSKETTKLKLSTYDALFGEEEYKELGEKESEVVELPLEKLHVFKGHPFRVKDDEDMYELADSIDKQGVLYPALIRPDEAGEYEIIAGHRRKRGSELAGKSTMPCIILNITHSEAVKIMVSTNIQRPYISISEKAFAFRLEMENAKNEKEGGRTDSWLAEKAGLGRSTIQRYIRLTYLNRELLDLVDIGNIGKTTGETLSHLNDIDKDDLYNFLKIHGIRKVGGEQAVVLKECSQSNKWSSDIIENVFTVSKDKGTKVTLGTKALQKYFPANYDQEKIEAVIFDLLERWSLENK